MNGQLDLLLLVPVYFHSGLLYIIQINIDLNVCVLRPLSPLYTYAYRFPTLRKCDRLY